MKARGVFVVLTAGLVLLLAGSGYAFWWAREQLLTKKTEIVKAQLDVVDEQKRTDQLVILSRRYSQAKAKLDDINTALPRESQQAEILLSIREAANQAGVTLPSIQFTGAAQSANPKLNQATQSKDLYVVPIALKLTGNYEQLISFLDRLERLSRYNSVGSLSLSKTNTDRDKLEITMSLNAYLKP